jgi:hypothetical protein
MVPTSVTTATLQAPATGVPGGALSGGMLSGVTLSGGMLSGGMLSAIVGVATGAGVVAA